MCETVSDLERTHDSHDDNGRVGRKKGDDMSDWIAQLERQLDEVLQAAHNGKLREAYRALDKADTMIVERMRDNARDGEDGE